MSRFSSSGGPAGRKGARRWYTARPSNSGARKAHLSNWCRRSLASSEAQVRDMSYGGIKLAFGYTPQLPADFDVTLPAAGITVRAHRVWIRPSPAADEFWCGVEITDPRKLEERHWREFVDSAQEVKTRLSCRA